MAQILINDTTMQAIAESVRKKTITEQLYLPSELAAAIDDIPQTVSPIVYNVTSIGELYTVSSTTWEHMDLSQYNNGDIFLITPA